MLRSGSRRPSHRFPVSGQWQARTGLAVRLGRADEPVPFLAVVRLRLAMAHASACKSSNARFQRNNAGAAVAEPSSGLAPSPRRSSRPPGVKLTLVGSSELWDSCRRGPSGWSVAVSHSVTTPSRAVVRPSEATANVESSSLNARSKKNEEESSAREPKTLAGANVPQQDRLPVQLPRRRRHAHRG